MLKYHNHLNKLTEDEADGNLKFHQFGQLLSKIPHKLIFDYHLRYDTFKICLTELMPAPQSFL